MRKKREKRQKNREEKEEVKIIDDNKCTLNTIFDSFEDKDDVYVKFYEEIMELINNFELIKMQYYFMMLYDEVFSFNCDFYFDSIEKNKLIKKE